MDTWMIYASSGEFAECAESAIDALTQFMTRRPDEYVAAVVNDGMVPKLVLAENV